MQRCCISGVAPAQCELLAQGGGWLLDCRADNYLQGILFCCQNWSVVDSSPVPDVLKLHVPYSISIVRKVFFEEAGERKLIGIVAILCNIRGKQEAQRMNEENYNPPLKQKIN